LTVRYLFLIIIVGERLGFTSVCFNFVIMGKQFSLVTWWTVFETRYNN